ncbi:hypothetical protein Van01_11660 [Micromonospora andamanensis]|uniref:Uncharacterized protein n=1 Tax=Micromonospora andamanensis TaxID=1287068 RepID=A0ABQ4HQP5_9ACTN|nr:hypothetical protein Van01_11660 [Micromonospora andamanensis]
MAAGSAADVTAPPGEQGDRGPADDAEHERGQPAVGVDPVGGLEGDPSLRIGSTPQRVAVSVTGTATTFAGEPSTADTSYASIVPAWSRDTR